MKPSDVNVDINSLTTQVKNTYSKLGIIASVNQRADPIAEIMKRRYAINLSRAWRNILGSEYSYAAGLLSKADAVFLSGPSRWLALQNSFDHAIFIGIQNYLTSHGLQGHVRIINQNNELIPFGTNLDRSNSFSQNYPLIADAFRDANDRRNKLPYSHPYDTKTKSRNRYLKPSERNALVVKLKNAYAQIANQFL
jgi:hypothetical protein